MDTCGKCKHSMFNGIKYRDGIFRAAYRCRLEPDEECCGDTPACFFFQPEKQVLEGIELEELPF